MFSIPSHKCLIRAAPYLCPIKNSHSIAFTLYNSDMNEAPPSSHLSLGLKGRCPNCGAKTLFSKWLKVADHCTACGEEFHHHRADDFPAYVVILIMGHVMVSFALWLEDAFAPPLWVHAVTTVPLCIVLSLAMLQPVKGAIVALQWHKGMHGFAASRRKREEAHTNS